SPHESQPPIFAILSDVRFFRPTSPRREWHAPFASTSLLRQRRPFRIRRTLDHLREVAREATPRAWHQDRERISDNAWRIDHQITSVARSPNSHLRKQPVVGSFMIRTRMKLNGDGFGRV